MSSKVRCATYARVSTEEQSTNYSLSAQRREVASYAEKQGFDIIEQCCDDGYSGGDLERPGLARIRELVAHRLVDVVLVYDPDRLSRTLVHQLLLTEEIEQSGVQLRFTTVPSVADDTGKLMLQIRGAVAEFEKAKIRDRTMRGRKEKARQGKIVGGRVTFGYDLRDGTYLINEEQAKLVKDIFQWFVFEGLSIRAVVGRLHDMAAKPYRAQRWAKSSVARILKNSTYVGRAYYNRRSRGKGQNIPIHRKNKKTLLKWKPESEWIAVSVPPIVSEALFDGAQQRLVTNVEVKSGRPANSEWLLSGLLRCARCGRRYASKPSKGTRYYRCVGLDKLNPRPCTGQVLANDIEEAVWQQVTTILSDPALLKQKLSFATDQDTDCASELERINVELVENRRKESKLLDLLMSDLVSREVVLEKVSDLRKDNARLDHLKKRQEDRMQLAECVLSLEEAARDFAYKVQSCISTASDKKRILQAILQSVLILENEYKLVGAVALDVPPPVNPTLAEDSTPLDFQGLTMQAEGAERLDASSGRARHSPALVHAAGKKSSTTSYHSGQFSSAIGQPPDPKLSTSA